MKKQISLYLPILIWMGFIFYLSSFPKIEVTSAPFWNFITRKAAHLTEYGILAFLIFRASGYKKFWQALILTTLYAASDEYHQTLVPGRTGKISDIIFDLAGALLYLGVFNWKLLPILAKKPKN